MADEKRAKCTLSVGKWGNIEAYMSDQVEVYPEMMFLTCFKHTLSYVCDYDLNIVMEISIMHELRFDRPKPSRMEQFHAWHVAWEMFD